MSITASDLILYCSLNMPEDDSSTSGGDIDTTIRPEFTQLTANAVAALVSDGADTRNVTVYGRLPTGARDSEVITLNGTQEVVGSKTFERMLKVVAASTDANRTVTVKQGSGGSTIGTIPPNEKGFHIVFLNSASESGAVDRVEKLCWKNVNATPLTLTDAQLMLSADPSGKITVGVEASKNATASVANRKTMPGGIAFVDDNVAQDVPGTTLEGSSFIGYWVKQSLAANNAALKSTFTTQLSGKSI